MEQNMWSLRLRKTLHPTIARNTMAKQIDAATRDGKGGVVELKAKKKKLFC